MNNHPFELKIKFSVNNAEKKLALFALRMCTIQIECCTGARAF